MLKSSFAPSDPAFLDLSPAAVQFHCTSETLRRWIVRGLVSHTHAGKRRFLRAIRVGGRYRVHPAELESFIAGESIEQLQTASAVANDAK